MSRSLLEPDDLTDWDWESGNKCSPRYCRHRASQRKRLMNSRQCASIGQFHPAIGRRRQLDCECSPYLPPTEAKGDYRPCHLQVPKSTA